MQISIDFDFNPAPTRAEIRARACGRVIRVVSRTQFVNRFDNCGIAEQATGCTVVAIVKVSARAQREAK